MIPLAGAFGNVCALVKSFQNLKLSIKQLKKIAKIN